MHSGSQLILRRCFINLPGNQVEKSVAEWQLLWRKPDSFCPSTSCQCEFIWGCTSCSAAHTVSRRILVAVGKYAAC